MSPQDARRLKIGTPILCPPGWKDSESGVRISHCAFGHIVEVHTSMETGETIALTIEWEPKWETPRLTTHGVTSEAMKAFYIAP